MITSNYLPIVREQTGKKFRLSDKNTDQKHLGIKETSTSKVSEHYCKNC
jgi:hypothetical protein